VPLSLQNTLTGRKEPFSPAEPGHARLYVCGPTVYDFAHLGHARCYIVYDVLVRHLRASGLRVTYCRNVTDVDDKILKRAAEAGEPPTALARRFGAAFTEDMDRLGNLRPDLEPHVTDHVQDIIRLIERLVASGAAYEADGDVYFDVSASGDYGALSHRNREDLVVGASGRMDEEVGRRKRNPADFALWKRADEDAGKPGALVWDSPFGKGRPGWHIECSAMSMCHLGETFDLHGGGLDLVFPHHENERAISEKATGRPYVRHWVHNGFVEVDRQKMSKSLGNFFTARELFGRIEPEALRYYAFTVHYRSPMALDWTLDEAGQVTGFPQIEEAEGRVEYLYRTRQRLAAAPAAPTDPKGFGAADYDTLLAREIAESLDDDLNMPAALVAVGSFLKRANELVDMAERKKKLLPGAMEAAARGFDVIRERLGLGTEDPAAVLLRIRERRARARGLDPAEIEARIAARVAARGRKEFAEADAIRGTLEAQGVELLDRPGGTDWRIV
jgi:cysteinyl-tRNA synthetase